MFKTVPLITQQGMGPAATHQSAVVTTLLPWVLPWGYQLHGRCGSKNAETPALLPIALFPFEL